MGKALTSYDIELRLAYMLKAISNYSNDLMLKRKLGADCRESECKLILMSIYLEILSCYKNDCVGEYSCLTQTQLEKIFDIVSTLTGYCFPPTGLNRKVESCVPTSKIVPYVIIET